MQWHEARAPNGCGKPFSGGWPMNAPRGCIARREPARCGGHGRHCILLWAPLHTRDHTRGCTCPITRGIKSGAYCERPLAYCKSINIQSKFRIARTSCFSALAHTRCHSCAGSRALAWAPCIASGRPRHSNERSQYITAAFEEDAGTASHRPSQN